MERQARRVHLVSLVLPDLLGPMDPPEPQERQVSRDRPARLDLSEHRDPRVLPGLSDLADRPDLLDNQVVRELKDSLALLEALDSQVHQELWDFQDLPVVSVVQDPLDLQGQTALWDQLAHLETPASLAPLDHWDLWDPPDYLERMASREVLE